MKEASGFAEKMMNSLGMDEPQAKGTGACCAGEDCGPGWADEVPQQEEDRRSHERE